MHLSMTPVWQLFHVYKFTTDWPGCRVVTSLEFVMCAHISWWAFSMSRVFTTQLVLTFNVVDDCGRRKLFALLCPIDLEGISRLQIPNPISGDAWINLCMFKSKRLFIQVLINYAISEVLSHGQVILPKVPNFANTETKRERELATFATLHEEMWKPFSEKGREYCCHDAY